MPMHSSCGGPHAGGPAPLPAPPLSMCPEVRYKQLGANHSALSRCGSAHGGMCACLSCTTLLRLCSLGSNTCELAPKLGGKMTSISIMDTTWRCAVHTQVTGAGPLSRGMPQWPRARVCTRPRPQQSWQSPPHKGAEPGQLGWDPQHQHPRALPRPPCPRAARA